MKRLSLFPFVIALLVALSARCDTADLIVNMADCGLTPAANTAITLIPFKSFSAYGNSIILGTAIQRTTDVFGVCVFSNRVVGQAYKMKVQGFPMALDIGLTNGTPSPVYAASMMGVWAGDTFAFLNCSGCNTSSGGSGTNGVAVAAGTNTTTQTNAGVVTVNADVSHAEVTAATNGLNGSLQTQITSTSNALSSSQALAGTTISNATIQNLSGYGTNLNLYSQNSGVPLIVNKNTSGHLQEWNGTFGQVGYVTDSGTAQFSAISSLGQVSSISSISFDNGAITSDGSGNITATSFIGSGSGLTSLTASQLSSGTIPPGRYGTSVVQTNTGAVLAITDGSGHTSSNTVVTLSGTGGTTVTGSGNTFTINSTSSGGSAYTTNYATLTDGATVTANADISTNGFLLTLGGNRTLTANNFPARGTRQMWWIYQDSTGNRTCTIDPLAFRCGAGVTAPSNVLPTTTNANYFDIFLTLSTGTNLLIVGWSPGFAN